MSYMPYDMICHEREHGNMEYICEGYYRCPVCGYDYQDQEYDFKDDDIPEIHDVARLWFYHDKDIGYTVGYSEKELEEALKELNL